MTQARRELFELRRAAEGQKALDFGALSLYYDLLRLLSWSMGATSASSQSIGNQDPE
jgi:hypothetical protein